MIKPAFIDNSRISVGKYMRHIFSLYLNDYWWIYALPLVICFALSLTNINFIFVAIVLLFLVFTIILYNVVLYYGLIPECRYSITLKDAIVSEDGVDIIMKKPIDDVTTEDKSKHQYEIEKKFFHKTDIKGFKLNDGCLLVFFKQPKYSFIAFPYKSFRNNSDLSLAIKFINKY